MAQTSTRKSPPPPAKWMLRRNDAADVLLARYLVHCAAYYVFNVSLIPDAAFDREARQLAKIWDEVGHPHKRLIDFGALSSGGTGFYLVNNFPQIIINAAKAQIDQKRHGLQK